jgi:hypothetical protein
MDAALVKLIILIIVGVFIAMKKVHDVIKANAAAAPRPVVRKPVDDVDEIPEVIPVRKAVVKTPPRRVLPPPLPTGRKKVQQPQTFAPPSAPVAPMAPNAPLAPDAPAMPDSTGAVEPPAPPRSPVAARFLELLKDRDSIRAALVLSEVLGPPRCKHHLVVGARRRPAPAEAQASPAQPTAADKGP